MLDLIGAIALGAAAVVLASVYVSAAWHGRRRLAMMLAGALAAWFLVVVACGATGAFDALRGTGPAGMGIAVVVPVVVLSYWSMRGGALSEALNAVPLTVLIGVHAMRLLGMFFVLLFWSGRLPAPFAPSAGWGDVLVGITALPVAYLAATGAPGWRPAALAWNVLGLADLVDAIVLGVASSPGFPLGFGNEGTGSNLMTTLPWILIPCFIVPLLVHLHLLIFRRLWHRAPQASSRPGQAPAPHGSR
ncbi:MAG: hypothetical protein JO067_04320 [Cupriavidus sp.]|nr:hypothetical protein [Cupriavidus sp.]